MKTNRRHSVRIIAGSKKGSRLSFPAVDGLRPSGDRIRETLFAWMQTSIADTKCLDMFAGSGALGFEAASRGATQTVLIEKHHTAARALNENADRLRFDNVEVISADALADAVYENQLSGHQFNLVFIDPPFADNLHSRAIECVLRNKILAPDAHVYLESGKRDESIDMPEGWELMREKLAGEVRMQLYRVIAGS